MGKLQNFNHKISKMVIEFFLNDFKFFLHFFQEKNSAGFQPQLSSCRPEIVKNQIKEIGKNIQNTQMEAE